ncbi:hypothetical protein ACFLY3_04265 [Chloroflexota bacterium]
MTTILIVSLVFIFGLGLGAVVFWFFYKEITKSEKPVARKSVAYNLVFRWKYILLPIALLLLVVTLGAIFYPQLTEEVAYRFNLDGSTKSWLSREAITSLALIPQFVFALVSAVVVWGIIRLSRSSGQTGGTINPERLVLFMGNMVALPQVIIGFVMLDIFSYNVYSRHLMPVWLFALIAMVLAGIVLTIFFIQTIKRSRQGS